MNAFYTSWPEYNSRDLYMIGEPSLLFTLSLTLLMITLIPLAHPPTRENSLLRLVCR